MFFVFFNFEAMNIKNLTPEEELYLKILHSTFETMLKRKKLTPAVIVSKTQFLHSNISRDKKECKNHCTITLLRKCEAVGIEEWQLIRKTKKEWLRQLEEQKKNAAKNFL